MEIYQEVARWQKELHSSLASEVQSTVEKHLTNIAQVTPKKLVPTHFSLIHDYITK